MLYMLEITICPSCGSDKIKKLKQDWKDKFEGQSYTVPDLEYWECPACGERLFDHNAMRKIEAYCPAFVKKRAKRKVSKAA
jgi:YgiT-type zinc finger domain-containing protein